MENSCGYIILTFMFISCYIFHYCTAVTYTVVEEGKPNSAIGNIAVDFNFTVYINEGRSLRFSFLNQDQPHVSYFNISENTGILYTVGVLDRENICDQPVQCSVILEIAVTATKSSFFDKVKVNVTIEDVNDHAPNFSKPFEIISFSESSVIGTSFTVDGAVDPDSSKFAVKSYNIRPTGLPFSTKFITNLDGTASVQIIVSGELDRESKDHYEIQLHAADGGTPPLTGILPINITITDVNDNFPEFTNKMYNASVEEDISVNSTILHVTANDLDIGDNSKIIYSFAAHQPQDIESLFSIHPETGEIKTIGRLVYSPGHQYQVIVEASDSGVPPKTTQALVYVHVQDVNNNAPKIKLNLLSSSKFAKISEHADIGAVVALIGVTDDDVGWNGITNCTLESDTFSLQKSDVNEYKVIVTKPLDREKKSLYNVSVFCEDLGTPPINSTSRFNVSVIDENDHVPIFSQQNYKVTLNENNNYGDVILTVSAFDADIGNNAKIHYELRSESWTDFIIEPTDGTIRAMKPFDREDQDLYEFFVLAIDGGKEPHTSTATVTLTILDENDNRPNFELAHYDFKVPENHPQEKVVGQVVAIDKDSENNGIVTYNIAENSEIALPFKLDPNGFLKTKIPLDREFENRYDFTIVATDQGSPKRLSSSVNVSVFVSDTNDNGPFFRVPDKSGHVVHVSVTTPVNTPLYLIKAFDVDEGRNAELIYKIEDRNDTNIFDINDMGQILVARPIEKGEINLYMIEVVVYDRGSPQNYAKTRLMMSVTAANKTTTSPVKEGLHSQNLLIALTVVIVTVVLAATIVVTICVIRRMDKKKQEFFGADCNSDHSSEAEVAPGLQSDGQKDFYSGPNNTTHLAPVVSHMSLDRSSITKDYIYKPRMNTPTPSVTSAVDPADVDMQIQGNRVSHDNSAPSVNRLASLRLHQALIQSHDKQWTNHNDSEQNNDMYLSRPGAEDTHSQLSEDGDSGRGGSVSDGHMGISQDADDLRIMQLQNIVRQSGRRGTPPHLQRQDFDNKYPQKPSNLTPRDNQSNLTPRDNHMNQSNSNSQSDQSFESRKLNPSYSRSNTDLYNTNNDKNSNIQSYPSYQENNGTTKTVTFCNNPQKVKSGPGIQMGLSSFSSQHHPHSSRHKPHRQHSFDTSDNCRYSPNYSKSEHNRMFPHNNRQLDETMDSITTTAYDDDDNTTTSGSYTIDNNANEDFMELNVSQLKDIFV
ncbi:protocadherin-1-like [Mercenaria mercenaria]|uniref:protocadherin-1-like n=1 Tax=Mercenaria mercenaria TaxID=6596 RepID=UPI00234EE352|nr:protocadherin-1-like [Mercenaria mercenaria]XP_053399170.1 protocadherin-1-like [Mercenaria mercenaria]